MMFSRSILHIPVLSLLLAGCTSANSFQSEPLTGRVLEILSDKTAPEYLSLESSASRNAVGSIFVVGEYDRNQELKHFLFGVDRRNNVNGGAGSDGIADFAGEELLFLNDVKNSPYSDFFVEDRLDALRNLAVDHCLSALDTVYSISPYDVSGSGRKKPSKFVILNSSYFTAFGEYDVSYLLRSAGSAVEVITPLNCMLEELMDNDKEICRAAVLCSPEVRNPEVYQTSLRQICNKNGKASSECFVHRCAKDEDPVFGILDSYVQSQHFSPLDAILVDDCSVDSDAARCSFARIQSLMDEASLKYGPFVSKDCKLLFASEVIADRCYGFLRKNNLFRLMIARPQCEDYMTTDGWMIPYSESYISVIK